MKMLGKVYAVIVVVIAAGLAIMVNEVSIDNVDHVMQIIKFFDVMIPVLAVGALLKYIWSCSKSGCQCGCGCCSASKGSCGSEKK